jgi:tRNA A37 threonylcarbamoyladenosine synthetase subunit TsaC/SUA5/YrdC
MIHTESTTIDTASNGNAHSNATSTNATNSTTMTTTLARMTNSTRLCGTTLQNGQLVAFPTETVYGLGGDANNRTAVQSIFTMKQRPMTDPIIVHVLHPINAYPLWQATAFLSLSSSPSSPLSSSSYTAGSVSSSFNASDNVEGRILQALCNTFWPGPLTIVAQACIETFVIAAAAAVNNTNPTNLTSDTTTTTATPTLPTTLSLLTANTGYIAVRSPMHTVARDIIRAAQSRIGIAAPSANVFGHVSPTTSRHVYDDFQSHNVLIYDEHAITDDDDQDDEEIIKEERKGEDNKNSITSVTSTETTTTTKSATTSCTSRGDVVPTLSCQVGVESTVVKVEQVNVMDQNMTNNSHHNHVSTATAPQGTTNNVMEYRVTLLRQGAVSCQDIVRCLQDAGLLSRDDDDNHPHESTASTTTNTYPKIIVSSNTRRATSEHETNVAPGQTIRHYSPNVPSYLVAPECIPSSPSDTSYTTSTIKSLPLTATTLAFLKASFVIDYGQQLKSLQPYVLKYMDLSVTKNSQIAAQNVFRTLRYAENIPNIQHILFPQYLNAKDAGSATKDDEDNEDDALTLAIQDRLTRAASGVVLTTLQQPLPPIVTK